MKPLYSPAEVQFRVMKEDVKDIFEDPVSKYFPEPIEKSPAGWYCWEREYSDEGAIRVVAPFTPGEKCYLREVWGSNMVKGWEGYGKIFYRADMPDQKTVPETYGHPWRSPVTMPQWAARRFFTVISCEPVRVSEVTEEDAIRYGVYQFHSQSKGLEDKPYYRSLYSAQELFRMLWTLKHPDKEWAWRVESEEEKYVSGNNRGNGIL